MKAQRTESNDVWGLARVLQQFPWRERVVLSTAWIPPSDAGYEVLSEQTQWLLDGLHGPNGKFAGVAALYEDEEDRLPRVYILSLFDMGESIWKRAVEPMGLRLEWLDVTDGDPRHWADDLLTELLVANQLQADAQRAVFERHRARHGGGWVIVPDRT